MAMGSVKSVTVNTSWDEGPFARAASIGLLTIKKSRI